MPQPWDDPLATLISELEHHPVNTNSFFLAFRDERLSPEALRVFVEQYRYFCHHFVKVLEGLLYRTPLDQLGMRIELVKTLYSELGHGDPAHAHIALLDRFAAAVGLTETALAGTHPLDSTQSYLDTLARLFLDGDFLVALGAELAVETTAISEFRYLHPGLAKYQLFGEETLTFFTLHLKEEPCHSDWLQQAVRTTVRSPGEFERVAAGARQTADAWHAFWLGLYEPVFGRAPATTSSDGAQPGAVHPARTVRP